MMQESSWTRRRPQSPTRAIARPCPLWGGTWWFRRCVSRPHEPTRDHFAQLTFLPNPPPPLPCPQVVNLLSLTSQGNRCITIRGRRGVGTTALASRVCHYLVSCASSQEGTPLHACMASFQVASQSSAWSEKERTHPRVHCFPVCVRACVRAQAERNLFDAIYLVPLQRRDGRSSDKEALCKAMGAAIGFEDASNEREIVFLLQASRAARTHACTHTKEGLRRAYADVSCSWRPCRTSTCRLG
jgi:hypothetical protein